MTPTLAAAMLPAAALGLTVGLLLLPVAHARGYRKAGRDAAEAAQLTSWQQVAMETPGRHRGAHRATWRQRWARRAAPVAIEAGPVTEEFRAIVATSYAAGEIPSPGLPLLRAHMATLDEPMIGQPGMEMAR